MVKIFLEALIGVLLFILAIWIVTRKDDESADISKDETVEILGDLDNRKYTLEWMNFLNESEYRFKERSKKDYRSLKKWIGKELIKVKGELKDANGA